MSPPLLGVGEECQSNATLPSSSTSLKSSSQNLELHERNYMGLFDCPSMNGSTVPAAFGNCKSSLKLRATELRLGLPGSQSPERDTDLSPLNSGEPDEKLLFHLYRSNNSHSGNKRGFADAMNASWISEGKFMANSDLNAMLSPKPGANMGEKAQQGLEDLGPKLARGKEVPALQERPSSCTKESQAAKNSGSAPAPKAQVVGWPPIRLYRTNSLAATSKNAEEVDGKSGAGAMFLKVSMDGAPYLRKVDLKNYATYQELSSALEKMFSCFIIGEICQYYNVIEFDEHGLERRRISSSSPHLREFSAIMGHSSLTGQYGSNGTIGKEKQGDNMSKDAMDGKDYVLTYEDKDGDWMLVGDVPWEMFLETCRKLRIMKSSDAIGLAPRAAEKCKSKI